MVEQYRNMESNETWEPYVQTSLRKSLHGSELARFIVAAGVRFIESELVPEYIDVMLPGAISSKNVERHLSQLLFCLGDVATAFISGKVLCELSVDKEFVVPEKSDPVMKRWLDGLPACKSRGPSWEHMISRLDAMGRHRRAFLVVQRANGGEQQLSELQYEAAVHRDLHIAVVAAPQGYATFIALLIRQATEASNRTEASAPTPLSALRNALATPRPLTRRDILAIIATLPGVDPAVAEAMLRRFHCLGAILTASEDELATVPGVPRLQVCTHSQ